jgi:hypothetical protein
LNEQKIIANAIVNWITIRKYLLRTNPKCFECNITEWNSKPITFECDHIDGDITNNRLSNARLLCPNCHSQTSTFRAKNINNPNGQKKRRERYYKTQKVEPQTGLEPASIQLCTNRLEGAANTEASVSG